MAQMQKGRVMRAAAFLMATVTVSRILGYARDVILYGVFGRNYITDSYTAAFIIPDNLYLILVGGALTTAFIPVFSSYMAKEQSNDAWKVSDTVITWAILLMAVATAIAYAFTPQLVDVLAPGFGGAGKTLTIVLTRIMLLQPFFIAMAGISMGILYSHQQFTWPAVGSMFYNLFIVLGGAFLAGPIEARYPGYGVAGFSIGVVVGSMIYFVVQIPALKSIGFRFRPSLNVHHPGFKRIIQLMIPALIGLSVQRVNMIVNTALASTLVEGAVAALRMAQRFMDLPIGIFAISIAVAIFPTMTQQAALKDMPEFKKSVSMGIRSVAYICLPAAVGLIVLREPIIRLLFEFQSGEFSAADTLFTGQALLFYCLGLAFYGIVQVLLRGFYALQDTITPVLVSVATIVVNLCFSLLLLQPLRHMGLPLAFSIAGLAQCALLFLLLRRRIGQMDLRHMLVSFAKTGAVCVVMGFAAWGAAEGIAAVMDVAASKTAQIIQLGTSMGLAVLIFFGITYFMQMEEAKVIIDMFKRRMRRKQEARG